MNSNGKIVDMVFGGVEEGGLWNNKDLVNALSNMPRGFNFEGKTKREVEEIIGHVEQRPTDLSLHCLLNGHLQRELKRDQQREVELRGETRRFRGFTVLNGGDQKIRQIDDQEVRREGEEDRPVWYVLSGMGIEEWKSGMCKEMMRFDAFRRSIMRSCELLRGYGIDLMEIVNGSQVREEEEEVLSKLKSFVGLTSIQIALVDYLSLMGIKHDGLIGYSIGELVCAYADKCMTHEQTLLCSYFIGKCIQEFQPSTTTPILREGGLMVQVCDLTWEQLKMKCPNGIVPVCFDSVDQYMITGPKQQIREFMRQLQLEGVYVKEIEEKSAFCLMHSFYLTPCVEQLRKYLSTLNIKPTQRSTKWISTSIPESKWSESSSVSGSSSVEYFLNMLCSPVMFHHALRNVPKNAIVVEISPRSLVQTLLKKALLPIHYQMIRNQTTTQNTIIPLMPSFTTTTTKTIEHFLTQLGRLYLEGVDFDSFKLYFTQNQMYYPVPVTVELLNELNNKFNIRPHTSLYFVQRNQTPTTTTFTSLNGLTTNEIKTPVQTFKYTIDIESLLKKEDSYLLGHQINGRVLYPTSGYLYLVWKSLAQIYKPTNGEEKTTTTTIGIQNYLQTPYEEQEYWPSVEFENVQIHRATVLRDLIEQQYFYQQQQQQVLLNNNEEKKVVFEVRIEPLNGKFELVDGENNLIVSGNYTLPTVQEQQTKQQEQQQQKMFNNEKKSVFEFRIEPLNDKFELVEGEDNLIFSLHQQQQKHRQQDQKEKSEKEFLSFRKHWEHLLNGKWNLQIEQEEFYNQLRSMGYEYNGEFKSILRTNVQGTQAEIAWTGKWIPCLDALIQLNIFHQQQQQKQKEQQQQQLLLPTRIRSIRIDPRQHMIKMDKSGVLPVIYEPQTNKIHCGAIEITGLELIPVVLPKGKFYPTTIKQTTTVECSIKPTILETFEPKSSYSFVPYVERLFDGDFGLPEEYVVVDKIPTTKDIFEHQFSLKTKEYDEINAQIMQHREFFEYYLNECGRYIKYIISRIEEPSTVSTFIEPNLLPKFVQEHLENITIYHRTIKSQTPIQIRLIELLEGGKLLKFLKQVIKHFEQLSTEQIKDINLFHETIYKMFLNNFSFLKSIQEDIILNYLHNKTYYLKSFLDTLLENTITIKGEKKGLKILEISPSMSHFFGNKIEKFLNEYPELSESSVEYHYLPLRTNLNNKVELIDEYFTQINKEMTGVQMKPIEKLNFEYGILNGQFVNTIPTEFEGKYDMIVLNGTLSGLLPFLGTETEIKKWLQVSMEKYLKPTGFMFVHEHTFNFEFADNLHKLEQIVCFDLEKTSTKSEQHIQNEKLSKQIKQLETFKQTIINSTEQGKDFTETLYKIEQQLKQLYKLLAEIKLDSEEPIKYTWTYKPTGEFKIKYQTEMQWRQIVEECGFYPTGLKSDNISRTMFLYRRPISFNGQEVKIFIDDEITWFEKVRSNIKDTEVERVWLISTKPMPKHILVETIKAISDLKVEFGAEKIRCLFIMDKEPIQFRGQIVPVEQWTHLFEKIKKTDLYMNVFQYGKWGSYRQVKMEHEMIFNGIRTKSSELFNPRQTYMIIGGLDCDFGFELAKWMVESGARYLLVSSHKQVALDETNIEQYRKLRELQVKYDVEIHLGSLLDLTNELECLSFVKKACQITMHLDGKIGGVFHLNGLVENKNTSGVYVFDQFTRMELNMPVNGLFVVFTKNGEPKFLERVCESRRKECGKHALVCEFNEIYEQSTKDHKQALIKFERILVKSKQVTPLFNRQVVLMPKRVIEQLNNVELISFEHQTPVFVIHPIEGHVNMLRTWAKQMNYPVFGLQFTEEALKCETVEKLAEFYWQQIEQQFPQLTRVHLCGHSFGAPVAFEMSLRRTDRIVSLTLLDSGLTETFLNSNGQIRLAEFDEIIGLDALYNFYKQYVQPTMRITYEKFLPIMFQFKTFDERVRYVVREVLDKSTFQFDLYDLDQAVRSYVSKVVMAVEYVPRDQLKLEQVMLIKSIPSGEYPVELDGEKKVEKILAGLKSYFAIRPTVEIIDAEHRTFLEGENAHKIATILNEYLITIF